MPAVAGDLLDQDRADGRARAGSLGRIRTIERDAILDAAESVTMAKGPAGLTIAAVAEKMGITNGGVQYSFRSKEAMIAAMFERWREEYADRMAQLQIDTDDGHAMTRAHIDLTRNFDECSRRRVPSILVAILNSPQHVALTRAWYRDRVDAIDATTDEGRMLRVALFAIEGAFLMRLFGLVEMEPHEWDELAADVLRLIDREPVAAVSMTSRAA
ncbi:TetR/AcrR family transcriptional regulator [Sphingomonas sp. CFBP 13720]|uniref:TetR/AcrR family transcriptional regulator n=1 Tax=Sphingomonas sp. CFBP 13720 TaxID=2775302 RepID=UPI00237A538B|nr:TetR/AcrR family transcriptional regulator [Sphingomonas sp. CFBP 13720]